MLSAWDKKGESYMFTNVSAEVEKLLRSILPDSVNISDDLTGIPWLAADPKESLMDCPATVLIPSDNDPFAPE